MKTTILFLSVFLSVSLFGQNYDKLLQNGLTTGCIKASFQNLSNEGVALIDSDGNHRTIAIVKGLMASCFDNGIKVMAYDKSVDLLDSENILKEISEKISTEARYFFIIETTQSGSYLRSIEGAMYDSKNSFELVGYFNESYSGKCFNISRKVQNNIVTDYVAKKMKEAIQD